MYASKGICTYNVGHTKPRPNVIIYATVNTGHHHFSSPIRLVEYQTGKQEASALIGHSRRTASNGLHSVHTAIIT